MKKAHRDMVKNMINDIMNNPQKKKRISRSILSQTANIISINTAGTSSFMPFSFDSEESHIVSNNSRTVKAQADFVVTKTIFLKGIGEISRRKYTITTTIKVEYVKNGIIYFTAHSALEG